MIRRMTRPPLRRPRPVFSLKQVLELVSVTAAFASGMLLYYGSLGVPREKESWKGRTELELAIKRRQRAMVLIGIPCAILAFLCQFVLISGFQIKKGQSSQHPAFLHLQKNPLKPAVVV
jgi:hypothetical protein